MILRECFGRELLDLRDAALVGRVIRQVLRRCALAGLRAILEERMGVPARLSEPFRAFNVHRSIDREYLLDSAPYFAVGAGLSIRRPGDR